MRYRTGPTTRQRNMTFWYTFLIWEHRKKSCQWHIPRVLWTTRTVRFLYYKIWHLRDLRPITMKLIEAKSKVGGILQDPSYFERADQLSIVPQSNYYRICTLSYPKTGISDNAGNPFNPWNGLSVMWHVLTLEELQHPYTPPHPKRLTISLGCPQFLVSSKCPECISLHVKMT